MTGGEASPAPGRRDLYSFAALWQHYRDCRRNNPSIRPSGYSGCTVRFPTALSSGRTAAYRRVCIVTEGHKPREVFAADFRDRIAYHLLVAHQEPLFEPVFIHDSHACRHGRGALAASHRLTTFLRRATANGRRPAWTIHLDVASFFPSIHKATLFELLCRRTHHPELRWLTAALLFHDPTTDYRFRSLRGRGGAPGSGHYRVPARKSLFGRRNQRGLPIGNLPSQFWANVYLNELDQFAKHRLGCRHYVRYVELYGPQRLLAQRALGLRPARLLCFGWALTAGFPAWRTAAIALRALRGGFAVVSAGDHRQQRRAAVLLIPAS